MLLVTVLEDDVAGAVRLVETAEEDSMVVAETVTIEAIIVLIGPVVWVVEKNKPLPFMFPFEGVDCAGTLEIAIVEGNAVPFIDSLF